MKFVFKRKFFLIAVDILCWTAVCSVFNIITHIPGLTNADMLFNELVLLFFIMSARLLLRVYSSIWRYAGYIEYLELVAADFLGGCVYLTFSRIISTRHLGIWHSVAIVATATLAVLCNRFIYQVKCMKTHDKIDDLNKINVAIVGAGRVGKLLAQELRLDNSAYYKPYCFIDKDPQKIGNKTAGIPVYDSDHDILDRIASMPIQEIVIALPDLSGEKKQELYDFYKQSGCKIKVYDFPFSQDENERGKRRLRDFNIEDLLFRDAVSFDTGKASAYYKDKTVLITGGGGSIGSELCRQIAIFKPKKLIILDIYENNAYDIRQELNRRFGKALDAVIEIASVRDRKALERVFECYQPDVVFHAAAHKHVHLMEHNGAEAIKNNIFGTYNTANAAEKYGVKRFILISTDKAVNPTNIMGATKRMCELIVQSRRDSATEFAAVRFGNVLGSNGSVIPLFRRMIETGGPLTVTDRRVIRYFMTIPEAAQLVLQTGVMAHKSEIYVLDMGKPIKILDLAENMIKLAGLRPYIDIDITEIGLRPGEKLYEELLIKPEQLDRTENHMIFIEQDRIPARSEIELKLELLNEALNVEDNIEEAVRATLKQVIPTFREAGEINIMADESKVMKEARMMENDGEAKQAEPEKAGTVFAKPR